MYIVMEPVSRTLRGTPVDKGPLVVCYTVNAADLFVSEGDKINSYHAKYSRKIKTEIRVCAYILFHIKLYGAYNNVFQYSWYVHISNSQSASYIMGDPQLFIF